MNESLEVKIKAMNDEIAALKVCSALLEGCIQDSYIDVFEHVIQTWENIKQEINQETKP